jgi:hypothetical protein
MINRKFEEAQRAESKRKNPPFIWQVFVKQGKRERQRVLTLF